MRFIITLLLIVFINKSVFTQTPSKQEIQNQMAQVMRELNQQITKLEKQIIDQEKLITDAKKNKEDPDTIESMQEELNQLKEQLAMLKKQAEMMGGVTKGISKMSNKIVQQASQSGDEDNSVPKRDDIRIRSIPDKILTSAELISYVKNTNVEVEKKISPEHLEQAKFIYKTAKEKKPGDNIGTLASLCWMNNYPELALYFAGKACLDNMENADNLNNYAAFLTMTGGEHLALPILQNLNKNFPDNSTILNNIGQAWYGLGDMNNSKKYLDGAVKIYKAHSQANKTKTAIQKSEGKTQETVESLKRSIKEDYTTEDEAELDKLGYHVKYEDIGFKYPIKAQPLGIEKFMFTIPAYPFEGGVAAEISKEEWYDYRQKIAAVLRNLNEEKRIIDTVAKRYGNRLLANPALLRPYNNKIYKTANRKLTLLITEWGLDRFLAINKKMMAAGDTISKWRDDLHKELIACAKRHENDQSNSAYCNEAKQLATTFVSKANTIWQQRNTELLTFQKEYLNSHANLSLYATTDRSLYEQHIINIKIGFLTFLSGMSCEFEVGCIPTKVPPPTAGKVLPDYDSMNCQYKTELSIPYYEKNFSIKVECNRMTTSFDLPFIKAEIQENLNTKKMIDIVKGSVEISAGASKEISMKGPLSAEMELKGKAIVEIRNNTISQVSIEGELSAGVKNQSDQKLEVGANVRSTWNVSTESLSTTVSGTGLFEGSRVSYK